MPLPQRCSFSRQGTLNVTLQQLLEWSCYANDVWNGPALQYGSTHAVNTWNAQILPRPFLWHSVTGTGQKSLCVNSGNVNCALQTTPDPLPFKYPLFVHLLPSFESIFARVVSCFFGCVFSFLFFFFKSPLISRSVFLPLLSPLKVALRRHWHQTDTSRFPTSCPFMATDVEILYPFYLSLFALFL